MQERLHRIEHRADKKRMTVTSVMERANIKKLAEPDFTASLRAVPPSLLVNDEQRDPRGVLEAAAAQARPAGHVAALTVGQAVPGATLGNGGQTLTVRTK